MGLEVGVGTGTPIIPIFIGDRVKTMQAWRRILDRGVFVNAIIVPAVQPGRDLLRTSYMATHEDQQLDTILRIVKEVDQEMDLSQALGERAPARPGMPWMSSPS
jgi:8-amino-7-oxononanoate synthase